ncbi:MAG: DUF4097 domain-containing protein [Coriobacteriia bacterium]|nr:DUF4097 domain-containing protein [Coriobacteriia bacterium]
MIKNESTKPVIKTLWLLILAAFLMGLGLMGLGAALGGYMPTGFGPGTRGMQFWDWREGVLYDSRLQSASDAGMDGLTSRVESAQEDIHTISVSVVDAEVVLISTDNARLSYSIDATDLLSYRSHVRNGALTIEFDPGITFLGLGSLLTSGSNDQIIIEVPLDTELQRVELRTVSGNININTDQISQIKQADDGVQMLQVARVDLATVSGTISIYENVQVDYLDIASVSGEIFARSIGLDMSQGAALSVQSVSGSASIKEANLRSLNVDIVSGRAQFHMYDLDDFSIEASNVSGTVRKDGNIISSGIASGTAIHGQRNKIIEVSTVSGDVDFDTAP